MGIVPGLLASVVLAAGGPPQAPSPAPASASTRPIIYRVQCLEMEGLGWREAVYSRLEPVARQGNAAIWTAGRDVAADLARAAGRAVQSPAVTAGAGESAFVSFPGKARQVASQLVRHADGPFDHAVEVAYVPEYETVHDGLTATIVGRPLDQGVLVRLACADARLVAVHQVKLVEHLAATDPSAERADGPRTVTPQVEVPEVDRSTVEGEWLIPHGGVLVVSLGASTAADADGRAVTRERIALIEAGPLGRKAPQPPILSATRPSSGATQEPPAAEPKPEADPAEPSAPAAGVTPLPGEIPAPAPAPPSRTLPEPISADGTPMPLPPLPDDQIMPARGSEGEPPAPSPQAPAPSAVEPAPENRDPATRKARYEVDAHFDQAPPPPPISTGAAARGWQPVAQPFSLRIPLPSGDVLEVSARALVHFRNVGAAKHEPAAD